MMIEIGDKIISTEIFTEEFVCDLSACKGACCVEGDSGAPLEKSEITAIEENLEQIKPFMNDKGLAAIEKKGVHYLDEDNEPVTTLVNNNECAFVYFEKDGIAKCSIEKAHREGKTKVNKPISCHLYPIRVSKYETFEALNYNRWHICAPACDCGKKLEVPVYKFLKNPIIRKWGEDFYKDLEAAANEVNRQE